MTVSENSYNSLVENQIQNRVDLEEVELLVGIVFSEAVVKLEVIVINHLGNAIHLKSAIMHQYLRIGHGNNINFTICKFVLKTWSLLETDGDFHRIGKLMVLLLGHLSLLLLHHSLELYIYFNALKFVVSFPLRLQFSNLILLCAPGIPVEFDLIDTLHSGLLFFGFTHW